MRFHRLLILIHSPVRSIHQIPGREARMLKGSVKTMGIADTDDVFSLTGHHMVTGGLFQHINSF